LFTLFQESVRNPDKLAQTFRQESDKVSGGEEEISLAFGRCVPEVDHEDLESILKCFPQVLHRSSKKRTLDRLYTKQEDSARFSPELKAILQKERIVKPYSEIYEPSSMNDMFVEPCFPPMQSDVVSQSVLQSPLPHSAYVSRIQANYRHFIAYVMRGVDPNIDLVSHLPYIYASANEKKIDIAEELPDMLRRINGRWWKVADCEQKHVACEQNVHVRLEHIIKRVATLTNTESAMLFAWAFVMERKGARAFSGLGFYSDLKPISYMWRSCIADLPNYLYALAEHTNIEEYGGCMRRTQTILKHHHAKIMCYTDIPEENEDSYSPEWRNITGISSLLHCPFRFLFDKLFSEGDPSGVNQSDAVHRSVIRQKTYHHVLNYMLRGVDPNIDLVSHLPYIYASATEKKLDILEELPRILKRIDCMMEQKSDTADPASMKNVRDRLKKIIESTPNMLNYEKALIFVWAFVMERQGASRVFYDLGFFAKSKPLSHIWARCVRELPKYLYMLAEYTDIQDYCPRMRSTPRFLKHEEDRFNGDIVPPMEDVNSYSPAWRKIMGCYFDAKNHTIAKIFQRIFPDLDCDFPEER